jgi:hypothetical protein
MMSVVHLTLAGRAMNGTIRNIGATFSLLIVTTSAAQQDVSPRARQAHEERKSAMQRLASAHESALNNLKGLSPDQKNAILAVMTISGAAAAYESRFPQSDDAGLRSIYGHLRGLSSAYAAPGKFQGLLHQCRDQTIACLVAIKKCEEGGRNATRCEADAKVIEPCGNEAACMMNAFMQLYAGVPQMLSGKDPWPPQPFPY